MLEAKTHYPGLNVLRGIAILLVVLYHYFYFFRIGWIGVDLFFVLSGFLITRILLTSRTEKNYFRKFFLNRILRIFPLYFLVLAVFYISIPFLFTQKGPGSAFLYYSEHQIWFWTFTQNWLLIKHDLPPEPYLQHFWSLAVEEQFYLVWPFLIYSLKRIDLLKNILIVIFFFGMATRLFLWLFNSEHEAFYYNTFARLDSLAAGAFLATMHFQNKTIPRWQIIWSLLLFLLVIASAFYFNNVDHNSVTFATIGYSVTAWFFMCLCYKMIHSKSLLVQNKFLSFLARISYGIYVYHLPVLLIGNFFLKKTALFTPIDQSGSYLISFLCLIATIGISTASYYLFEKPILNLKNIFNKEVG